MRFVVVKQFHVTKATNCLALTRCMKLTYVVGHEGAIVHLSQCVVSIV
jgi:hypothetical protein